MPKNISRKTIVDTAKQLGYKVSSADELYILSAQTSDIEADRRLTTLRLRSIDKEFSKRG